MKRLFYLPILAIVACLCASCEIKEPTAVLPTSINTYATVCGFVRYYTYDMTGAKNTNNQFVDEGTELTVLYGKKNAEGTMEYMPMKTTIGENGNYSIRIPVAKGKSVDEVKVSLQLSTENDDISTYGYNKNTWVLVDAIFYGENSVTNVACDQAYRLDVDVVPTVCTNNINVTFSKK